MPAPPWRAGPGRGWLACPGAGLAAVVASVLPPAVGLGLGCRMALYLLVSLSAAGALLAGPHRLAAEPRRGWMLLAGGQVLYAATGAVLFICPHVSSVTPGAAADVVLFLRYPLLVAGLLTLLRARRPGRSAAGLLDTAMVLAAACLLSWVYLAAPAVRAGGASAAGIIPVACTAASLVVVGVTVLLTAGDGERPATLLLLAGGVLVSVAADAADVFTRIGDATAGGMGLTGVVGMAGGMGMTGSGGAGVDGPNAARMVSALLLTAAACHPSLARSGQSVSPPTVPIRDGWRVAGLCGLGLVGPVVLGVQAGRGDVRDVGVIAVVSAGIVLLIIARMARLEADQRRVAITDGLTGLRTRRYLEAEMRVAARRARQIGSGMGLLLVDVDHFKSVNDRFGHPTGDQVLAEVARRLLDVTRPGDVVARYGGEEFALLALDVRGDALADIAERLRLGVGREPVRVALPAPAAAADWSPASADWSPASADWSPLPVGAEAATVRAADTIRTVGSVATTTRRDGRDTAGPARAAPGPAPGPGPSSLSVPVTVSVGGAVLPDHAGDVYALVAVADQALYAAKEAGRDRVAIGPEGAPGPGRVPAAAPTPSARASSHTRPPRLPTAGRPVLDSPPSRHSPLDWPAGDHPVADGCAADPLGIHPPAFPQPAVDPFGSVPSPLVPSPPAPAPLAPAPVLATAANPDGTPTVLAEPAAVAAAASAVATAVAAVLVAEPREVPRRLPDGVECLRRIAEQVDAWHAPRADGRAVGHWLGEVLTVLGYGAVARHRARLAGRLHNVGKILLPPHVLARPGPLDAEEWRLIRLHPVMGATLLAQVPDLRVEAEIIAQQREWFGGGGYPSGIAGSRIRMESRALAVCTAWAAMRGGRGGRDPLSGPAAREQLRAGRATQFDPTVVDVFLALEADGRVGLPHPDDRLTTTPAAWASTLPVLGFA
ncbi:MULTISPECIES: diguanylate cyclase [Frankia]|nr:MULTISPECIES: diguanylate cyclase [Frankia]